MGLISFIKIPLPSLISQISEAFFVHKLFKQITYRSYISSISKNKAFEVDWISGACMVIKREVYLQTNGFNQEYHIYYEDVDWCRRIHEYGWKIYCCPNIKVSHIQGASTYRNYFMLIANRYKSKRIFARTYFSLIQYLFLHLVVLFGLCLRVIYLPFRITHKPGERLERLKGYLYSFLIWLGIIELKNVIKPE